MTKRRSIGERMGKAKSLAARRETALEWWAIQHDDFAETISELEKAIGRGDMASFGECIGRLKDLDKKAFAAMPRVIEALADEDTI